VSWPIADASTGDASRRDRAAAAAPSHHRSAENSARLRIETSSAGTGPDARTSASPDCCCERGRFACPGWNGMAPILLILLSYYQARSHGPPSPDVTSGPSRLTWVDTKTTTPAPLFFVANSSPACARSPALCGGGGFCGFCGFCGLRTATRENLSGQIL